eukprot:jgi/Bigna1/67346/fgenesh1_pg.3_\
MTLHKGTPHGVRCVVARDRAAASAEGQTGKCSTDDTLEAPRIDVTVRVVLPQEGGGEVVPGTAAFSAADGGMRSSTDRLLMASQMKALCREILFQARDDNDAKHEEEGGGNRFERKGGGDRAGTEVAAVTTTANQGAKAAAKSPIPPRLPRFSSEAESMACLRAAGSRANVYVHRAMLASRSEFFRVMWSMPMRERSSGIEQPIELKGVKSSAALRAMVLYMYTASLSYPCASEKQCAEMLKLADQFGIPCLKQACERLATSALSKTNFSSFYFAAGEERETGAYLATQDEMVEWAPFSPVQQERAI